MKKANVKIIHFLIKYLSKSCINYFLSSCRFQNTSKKFLLVHRTCFNVMRKPLIKFRNIMLIRRNDARNRISDVRKWRGRITGVITYTHTHINSTREATECDVWFRDDNEPNNTHRYHAVPSLVAPTQNRHSNSGVYKAFSWQSYPAIIRR